MIYSCFDAQSGFYEYFETPEQIPINADLPVPNLPPMVADIGVSSIEAGRPLPANAVRVGSGWHARGIQANCQRVGTSGIGAMGSIDTSGTLVKLAIFGLAAWGALVVTRKWEDRTS